MDKAERERLRELCEAEVWDGDNEVAFLEAARSGVPALLDALAAAEERARGLEEDYARLADAAGAWTFPGWVFLRDRPEGVNLPDELKAARAALAPDAEGGRNG